MAASTPMYAPGWSNKKVVNKEEEVTQLVEIAYPPVEDIESRRTIKLGAAITNQSVRVLEPPPGRKPLLPRVYDHWDEEEEDDLDLDEAAIRARLRMKKLKDGDDEDETSDEEGYIVRSMFSQKTRKQRRKENDAKYEAFWKKEQEEAKRESELQDLEDLRFPNKWGWFYTDGYYDFDETFGIDEIHYKEHAEQERVFAKTFTRSDKETFTSKFKRHFWPPKLLQGKLCRGACFRTRGSYLDLPEIVGETKSKKFSPFGFNGIDVDFEHHGLDLMSRADLEGETDIDPDFLPTDGEGDGEGVDMLAATLIMTGGQGKTIEEVNAITAIIAGLPPTNLNVGWDDYYYDDRKGEFYRKPPGLQLRYYFDSNNTCWRRKRDKRKSENQLSPYCYYWDPVLGVFLPREEFPGQHKEDVAYDPDLNLWRFEPQESTHSRVIRGLYLVRHKLKKTDGALDPANDFYFDEEEFCWKKKSEAPDTDRIEWDGNGLRFIKRCEGSDWVNWRGATGYSPDDFYFDEAHAKFQIRPRRQPERFHYMHMEGIWRTVKPPNRKSRKKLEASDFFWEHGMFKQKEANQDHLYKQMKYSLIYKRKEVPISGLYCEDYYFDYDKRLWLPRVVRMPLLKIKRQEVPWEEGKEKMKQLKMDKQNDFFFDIEDGVFAKKTDKEPYYFDSKEGVFKSVELRNKYRLHVLPNDYFFNGSKFKPKATAAPEDGYVYDATYGIYRQAGKKGGDPGSFFFDYKVGKWTPKPKGADGAEIVKEPNGQLVRKSDRNPDSFYMDYKLNQFLLRNDNVQYTFVPNEGIYKIKGSETGPTTMTSRNFFYDDFEHRWKMKLEGHGKEYFWDKNNKFFRHIISLESRSGLKATDYYWNMYLGKWLPIVGNPERGKITDQELSWDPLRNYDRPWLVAAPLRYGDQKKKKKVKKEKDKKPKLKAIEEEWAEDPRLNEPIVEDDEISVSDSATEQPGPTAVTDPAQTTSKAAADTVPEATKGPPPQRDTTRDQPQQDTARGPRQSGVSKGSRKSDTARGYPEPDTSGGQPQPDTTEGQPQPDTARGPRQSGTSKGSRKSDTARGYPQPDTSGGQPRPDITEGQPQPDTARGPRQSGASKGSRKSDTARGHPQPDTSGAQPQPDTAEGQPQPDTARRGPRQSGTSKGSRKSDTARGHPQPDTSGGQPQSDTTEGQPQPDTVRGPRQSDASKGSRKSDAARHST